VSSGDKEKAYVVRVNINQTKKLQNNGSARDLSHMRAILICLYGSEQFWIGEEQFKKNKSTLCT